MSRRLSKHGQGGVGHFRQGVGVVGRHRVADAGLNVAPPAVIGAAETHEMGAPRVIAGEAHGLHDRLGPRHVERDLRLAGNPGQAGGVVGDQRRIGAQHRAERAHAAGAALHAGLVEIVAEQVDAVRAGQVVAGVAVEIGDLDAIRRSDKRPRGQMLLHGGAEREGHAVALGELQVGDMRGCFGRPVERPHAARAQQARQVREGGAAPVGDLGGRVVGGEEMRVVEGIARHQRGDAPGEARMSGEGTMLGARQGKPCPQLQRQHEHRQGQQREHGDRAGIQCQRHRTSLVSFPVVSTGARSAACGPRSRRRGGAVAA